MTSRRAPGRRAPAGSAPGREAPSRRAALAGVIVAGLLLALVYPVCVWDRPARLPTYPADAWPGESTLVADDLELAPRGLLTLCPSATVADGSRLGIVLADSWSARLPPLVAPAGLGTHPRVEGGPAGEVVEDWFELGDTPVTGRMLDLEDGDDAALAESWTSLCGEAAAVAAAAPDGIAGVAPGTVP